MWTSVWEKIAYLGLSLILTLTVGACGEHSDSTFTAPGTTTGADPSGPPRATESIPDTLSVDVNPAQDVILENVLVQGITAIHTYRVSYVRPDGNPEVPAPLLVFLTDPVYAAADDDAVTLQQVFLLRQEAMLAAPLNTLTGDSEPLTLIALVEFFGTDGANNPMTRSYTVVLECADF